MKLRNYDAKKCDIKKIYIDACPDFEGYRVLLCLNGKYYEYINKGVYLNNIFDEIEFFLKTSIDTEYIEI